MRDPDRPRRKKVRRSSSAGDGGVPMWAQVGAGVIMILGLLGALVRFAERRNRPDPAPNAAVAPAQPLAPVPPPVPNNPVPAPKRPVNSEPPPPARELPAKIVRVYQAPSLEPSKPFDLVVEYEFVGSDPVVQADVVEFCSPVSNGGQIVNDAVRTGTLRFSPQQPGQLDGEIRFWIDRRESDSRLRISNIYTFRR